MREAPLCFLCWVGEQPPRRTTNREVPQMASQQKLSPEQIRRIWPPLLAYEAREADIAVINMTGGTVEAAATYIWDHWLGEPETPTVEQVEAEILKLPDVAEEG